MELFRSFAAMSERAPQTLIIGNFDGVHRGHQYLLRQARADAAGGDVGVLTFEPHPLKVLRPKTPPARIGGAREKIALLAQQQIDYLCAARFTRALAQTPAEDFAEILFGQLRARRLVVGEDFRFGAGRRGDCALLRRAAARYGAAVTAAPLYEMDGRVVSSGAVRECLRGGDFARAARLLGRDWTISGRVMRGAGRGRRWGFPTANIRPRFTPPCAGIFAARADIDGREHAAAVSIGTSPTVRGDGVLLAEAHLPAFCGDLYGRRIALTFLRKLRDEQRFASEAALRDAIAEDVRQTRAIAG